MGFRMACRQASEFGAPQFLWVPGKMRQHTRIIFWDRYQMIFMD